MKHSKLLSVFILILSLQWRCLFSQEGNFKENDTSTCLTLIVNTMENNNPTDGIQITVFKKNQNNEWEEQTAINDHNHKFSLNLQCNSYYSIEIVKPGYAKRLISVSTIIPNTIVLKS